VISEELASMTSQAIRQRCREGSFNGPTAGVARGYAQVNVVILPADFAADFATFCRRNPRPCPLLEMTEPGVYEPKKSAPGADLRTDLPRFRVFRAGKCVERPPSIERYWPDAADLTAFLLGCSFTFERALLEAGLPVRHLEEGHNVPMYRTSMQCEPAGPFAGPLVVSMRPMTAVQADLAAAVTARYPHAHGAPIHVGDPHAIGIDDIEHPHYGDAVTIKSDEIPVFWACGVTPMETIVHARLPLAITHEPGHMFVTDLPETTVQPPVV